jgi:ADP-ribosyltransferase exoenzyme/ParB/Sulfiredoxin domain
VADDLTVYTYVVELPETFTPDGSGSTPEETAGWGWFGRKEILDLPLQPAFEKTWESVNWKDLPEGVVKAWGDAWETEARGPHGEWESGSGGTRITPSIGSTDAGTKNQILDAIGEQYPVAGLNEALHTPGALTDAQDVPVSRLTGIMKDLDGATVSRYANDIKNGTDIGAGTAVRIGGKDYLVDGNHRMEALIQSGQSSIPVQYIKGVGDISKGRRVDTNGQVIQVADEDDDSYPAAGAGAREVPDNPQLGELAPGGSVGTSPGNEPPHWQPSENLVAWSEETDGAGRAGAAPGAHDGDTPGSADDMASGTHASSIEGGHDDQQGYTGVPPHYDGELQGPGDGKWPAGGEGTGQPGGQSSGAASGIPPSSSAIVKDASDLSDPNPVEAEHVYSQLLENYPPDSIQWVKSIPWTGPVNVPQDQIDYDAVKTWAASHEQDRDQEFAARIKAGEDVHPVVAVKEPDGEIQVVDGHHRALAYKELGLPVKAYVGTVNSETGPWDELHVHQEHSGVDPANKAWGDAWETEARGAHGRWESGSLNSKQQQAIREYTASKYVEINEYRRNGTDSSMRIPNESGVRERVTASEMAGHISNAIQSANPSNSSTTLYRGVDDANSLFGTVGSTVGKVFSDKGIISTTSDVNSPFSKDAAILHINVPSGAKILDVSGLSKSPVEKEVLMDGLTGKVTADSVINGVRHLNIEAQ